MNIKDVLTYLICAIVAAAAGIGGTLLVQHHDDELQPSDVAIAAYFAEAISTPDTIDNDRVQDLVAPNTGWDGHSRKAEEWGQAIFKAYHDDTPDQTKESLFPRGLFQHDQRTSIHVRQQNQS